MLVAVIAACEAAFWLLLAAGLFARYVLRWQRTSAALLLSVPLVDVILLVATVLDLRGGGEAGFAHGLSAAYIGFSVAFGHSTIRWADRKVAHRFAGGPPPPKAPKPGTRARVHYEWHEFGKAAVAWAVSCVILIGMILGVGSEGDTSEFLAWIARLTGVLVIWLLGWPVWESVRYFLRFGRARDEDAEEPDRPAAASSAAFPATPAAPEDSSPRSARPRSAR